MKTVTLISLLIPALSGLAAVGSAPKPSVDCMQAEVRRSAADADRQRILHVVLTNRCGVDVTAFMLAAHIGTDPDRVVRSGSDFIALLRRSHAHHLRIPLAGGVFPWDIPLPEGADLALPARVDVEALIFADRTAAGDANFIAGFLHARETAYRELLQKYDFLEKIAQFDGAKTLLSQAPDPSLSPDLQAFWKENEVDLGWTDRASWADYVARRERETRSFIELFKLHSSLQTGADR